MIRKSLTLTENELSWLNQRSNKIGISDSELVRRILDEHIISESKQVFLEEIIKDEKEKK